MTPHVIFLDDATASAAHLKCHADLFMATGKVARFHSCVILDIRDRDHSVEEKLNTGVIKQDPVGKIPELLHNSDYPMVVRMAKSMLRLPVEKFQLMIGKLSPARREELVRAAFVDALHQKPAFKANLAIVAQHLLNDIDANASHFGDQVEQLRMSCRVLIANAQLAQCLESSYSPSARGGQQALVETLAQWPKADAGEAKDQASGASFK